MKSNILKSLPFLALAVVLALFAAPFALAQTAAPAAVAPVAPFTIGSLLNPQTLSVLIALVTSVVAYFKHTQNTGLRKALGAVVVGVEQASALPQVAHLEDTIKSTIQAEAQKVGAENVLHDVVAALTPAVQAQITALKNVPSAPATPAV